MREEEPIDLQLGKTSLWDPQFRILTLSGDPLDTGHELAHVRLGHTHSMGSILGDLVEEREAWKEALRRISPEEIKVSQVSDSLNTYLEEVGKRYGYGSSQYQMGSKMVGEVVEYAKKRKKEAI